MRSLQYLAIVFSLLLTADVRAEEKEAVSNDKSETVIEFRLAEPKPADGLVEATVAGTEQRVYLHTIAALTRAHIADAHLVPDERHKPAIGVTFTEEGAKKIAKLTSGNRGKLLAIVVDGKVISAPVIQGTISERGQITGNFTEQEAARITLLLHGKAKP